MLNIGMAYLCLLKSGPPQPPKICSETIVIEPFDDGWPEYEDLFTMVQG
jgi:hypothetical protein